MKIAFVTTSLKGGGAEKAILRTALQLQKAGAHVTVVILEQFVEHFVDPGLQIHFLTKKMHGGLWYKYQLAFKLRLFLKKQGPFDAVISTLPRADEICKLAKIPNLWFRIANTFSEELLFLERHGSKRVEKKRVRYQKIYHKAKVIAVSHGVAEEMQTHYHCSTRVIYNPLDVEELETLSIQEAPLPSHPYLIHVSRFSPHKRHDLLFEAYLLAKVKMPLVLLTKPSQQLASLIANYGLQDSIIIADFQKNPYPWIKNAFLLIHTSEYEGLPNVVAEALLLGRPVVCTDCRSGPKELLTRDLKEFLVPCNDPQALATGIKKALKRYPAIHSDIRQQFHPSRLLDAYGSLLKKPHV